MTKSSAFWLEVAQIWWVLHLIGGVGCKQTKNMYGQISSAHQQAVDELSKKIKIFPPGPKLFLVKTYHPKTTILTSENNFGLLSVIMCDNIWNMLCFLWYSLLEILEFLKHIAKFCIFMGFRGTFNTFVTCTLRTWKLKLI